MPDGHAHHLVHVVLVGAASLAFVAFVAVEVRRHGWPSFTWRIRSGGGAPPP